jgi:hypothetical protein
LRIGAPLARGNPPGKGEASRLGRDAQRTEPVGEHEASPQLQAYSGPLQHSTAIYFEEGIRRSVFGIAASVGAIPYIAERALLFSTQPFRFPKPGRVLRRLGTSIPGWLLCTCPWERRPANRWKRWQHQPVGILDSGDRGCMSANAQKAHGLRCSFVFGPIGL